LGIDEGPSNLEFEELNRQVAKFAKRRKRKKREE
jgi:hypothetical protein